MKQPKNIFEYVKIEEGRFGYPIPIVDGYEWSFAEHIRTSILYKNSQFKDGNAQNERDYKPFKNIVRPILNLQYRAEGFDVKDVEIFIDESKKYFKSFLVKKYHDKWAKEEELDTFIDEVVESYVDFGGALIKDTKQGPELVPLQSIAFCDQSDLLSGPIAIKHQYSPDQLKDMEEFGWGSEANGATISIDNLILKAETSKDQDGSETQTPGKYISVYELHGTLPTAFLKDSETEKYTSQMQIVAFYEDNKDKNGVVLFKQEEKESPFMLILRDKIFGRALGLGGVEELFDPQIWVNYSEIRKREMLDAAAKVILKTTDKTLAAKHPSGLKDLDNLEIIDLEPNTDLNQVDNYPRNFQVFEKNVDDWLMQARTMGAATESIMGEQPASGTPFALQELVTAEAHSLHEYRKGKIATFFEKAYRKWWIPQMSKNMMKGQEFLANLDLQEMLTIVENVMVCEANKMIKEDILAGRIPDMQAVEARKAQVRMDFMKDSKKFIKILEKEMKDAPLNVWVNIVGKQKYMGKMVDKMVNVFRQIVANPAVLDDPRMAKLFNEIMEASGLSPIDFGMNYGQPAQQTGQATMQPPKQEQTPLQALVPQT